MSETSSPTRSGSVSERPPLKLLPSRGVLRAAPDLDLEAVPAGDLQWWCTSLLDIFNEHGEIYTISHVNTPVIRR